MTKDLGPMQGGLVKLPSGEYVIYFGTPYMVDWVAYNLEAATHFLQIAAQFSTAPSGDLPVVNLSFQIVEDCLRIIPKHPANALIFDQTNFDNFVGQIRRFVNLFN